MLYIVTRGNYHHYEESISKAFKKREFKIPIFQEEVTAFEVFPEAVYFVGVDKTIGISGLARLLPATGVHICRSLSLEGMEDSSQMWELSAIHFFLPHNLKFLRCESSIATAADHFYREFFRALYRFVSQQNTHQILVFDHHLIIKDLSRAGWPLHHVKDINHDALDFPLSLNKMPISSTSHKQFLTNRAKMDDMPM